MEPVKVIFGGAEREPQGYTRCRVGGGCHSVAAGTGAESRYEIRRSLRRPFTLESEHRVYEPSKWTTGWARQVGHPGIGQKRVKRCCWKPPANRWSYAPSWACRNRLMSIFAICSIASITRFAFAGSLSLNSSPSTVSTICQDTPNLSFSQPHCDSCPPAESFPNNRSTASCVSQLTDREMASVNLKCGPCSTPSVPGFDGRSLHGSMPATSPFLFHDS